ncbi:hypothetical protein [Cellulomonas fimi]|uniref:Uncharacterized protein n=1 Tax=Cellulomonas fimi TaxID=1708 RepID=A0A7Y0LW61_CELFI|nr:hypothetical protein [Cellulomonas fimi]NMR18934.1 hypothetical protein [Cellulomonas fimi]
MSGLAAIALVVTGLVAGADLAPASAVPCEDCDPNTGGDPGGGGGGGGGPTPAPSRVTGRFTYADTSGAPTVQRPIAFAKVEVWRFAPRALGVWTWAPEATVTTDANGVVDTTLPFGQSGILYELRLFATNYAAVVHPNVLVPSAPFVVEPGEPGPATQLTATAPGQTLDFSWDFTDAWAPQHFNLAETVRRGFDFAVARRDPAETDTIPAARVRPTAVMVPGTFYNPSDDSLVIVSGGVFADGLILHEYAHFLEEQVGSFPWLPTTHDGCVANGLTGFVNSPEHAWMEGFASWFAQAVMLDDPSAGLVGNSGGGGGTIGPLTLETPSCTTLPAGARSDAVELFVAGALYDLTDRPSDPGSRTEPADALSRMDVPIFQIMDRELDVPPGAGAWPDINGFRNAWRARGLPTAELDAVLAAAGVTLSTTPDAPEPAPSPGPRVCLRKPWTPGCE